MRPTPPSPAWTPERLADRLPALAARARIASALRGHLADDGFIEVETPILQVSPGNEAHLHAFTTAEIGPDGTATPLYLHTSPEFACKKLLAAGATRLFTLARVFRNRERGPLHHPEFTMLEWYRAGEPYRSVIADSIAFLRLAAEAAGTDRLQWRGITCDPSAEAEWLTLAEAFDRFANIDLLATTPGGVPDRDTLAKAATIAGVRIAEDDVWADIFSRVLVEKIEPYLGHDRPTVLYEYPVCEAALARPAADPRSGLLGDAGKCASPCTLEVHRTSVCARCRLHVCRRRRWLGKSTWQQRPRQTFVGRHPKTPNRSPSQP